ncbi:universal stress protein [Phytomonospora sp. NPDC050363]|uniref:universal stress protein n=1 Tax=Phytomonospora sp. NPDC050363 TaxID=3155642 RepID=UPI0033F8C719
MLDSRPVVVGVDGSPASLAAVRYAVRLAERRQTPLHLVHAYQYPLPGYTMVGFAYPSDGSGEAAREQIAATLKALAERIRAEHPDLVAVHAEQVAGPAAAVLIELARGADVTVVGTRGHGGFAGLLLGSVAAQVATHAHGTVIVVPPAAEDGPDRAEDPVAVGFDRSTGAERALRFAAEESLLRGTALAVTRLYDPVMDRDGAYAALSIADAVKILLDEYPSLRVDADTLPSESIARGMIEISAEAGLTVVGSRGHGGFAGLLLGSIGRALLHHARGPVAVVHPTHAERNVS